MTDYTPDPAADAYNLVASKRGVRVDSETGWSAVVATDAEECDRLASSFAAMARRLRAHPEIVEAWDHAPELDTGCADDNQLPEALIRADERAQLAAAGRLLPAGAEVETVWAWDCGEQPLPHPHIGPESWVRESAPLHWPNGRMILRLVSPWLPVPTDDDKITEESA